MNRHRDGNENIIFNGMKTGFTLSDFWEWGFSDLLNNTLRGVYCEFLVATALGLDLHLGRENWTPWDLTVPHRWLDRCLCKDELHVEVKSGAYLQSWEQSKPSKIVFSIRPTHVWNEEEGYGVETRRQSDVYIFCLYTVTDRLTADPVILDGWRFYIVPTDVLNDRCGNQSSITLRSLEALNPIISDYYGLKKAILQSTENGRKPVSCGKQLMD